jgi:hypothetical protein
MVVRSDYAVGCDAHKHDSLFAVRDREGQVVQRRRVEHVRGAIAAYLSQSSSPVVATNQERGATTVCSRPPPIGRPTTSYGHHNDGGDESQLGSRA